MHTVRGQYGVFRLSTIRMFFFAAGRYLIWHKIILAGSEQGQNSRIFKGNPFLITGLSTVFVDN